MPHWALVLLFVLGQFAQNSTGELRLTITDEAGLPLPGPVEMSSEAIQYRQTIETDAAGRATVRRLPFGRYRVQVARPGFAPLVDIVEIDSALPLDRAVVLRLAALQSEVTVAVGETLLDVRRVGSSHHIGRQALDQRTSPMTGRALPDLVNMQPGWLLEANGILHPRGSEYQTQYVVDGLPLTDNRSPAFAPEVAAADVESMTILTGGYPAEYGRKLGGVIEVVTVPQGRRGAGGFAAIAGGSFDSASAELMASSGFGRGSVSLSASAATTSRYLDPPIAENATNRGAAASGSLHASRDLTRFDRLGLIVRRGQGRFLVPNERVQEAEGQRQDRASGETAAQFSYQRIVSPRVVTDIRGFARDITAALWSNAFATPIAAAQNRGLREGYLKGTLSATAGVHEVKAGADLVAGTVRERFEYRITDPAVFDPGTPAAFSFAARRPDREQSAFVQDRIRSGTWTISGGLRWDRYRLAIADAAVSPRLAVAWARPQAGLVLRASYDRAFQTPAVENLLLASADAAAALNDEVVRLPVPASRGNFYEAGATVRLSGRTRLDLSAFRRRMRNVADDDLFLNTGISFPVAFSRADIHGAELKLDVLPTSGTPCAAASAGATTTRDGSRSPGRTAAGCRSRTSAPGVRRPSIDLSAARLLTFHFQLPSSHFRLQLPTYF